MDVESRPSITTLSSVELPPARPGYTTRPSSKRHGNVTPLGTPRRERDRALGEYLETGRGGHPPAGQVVAHLHGRRGTGGAATGIL